MKRLDPGIEMLAKNTSNHNGTCVIIGNDDTLGRKASELVKVYFIILFFSLSFNSLIKPLKTKQNRFFLILKNSKILI